MKITPTDLPEVLLLQPVVHGDARGFFFESLRVDVLARAGILLPFVQENQSSSAQGTIRGLHYQLDKPQGKLVRVVRGAIFDVAVDIRVGSKTFGRWAGGMLSADNRHQLYIPPGFAHGFAALEDGTEVIYKCTDYYSGGADQRGVLWNDPSIGIAWPFQAPVLSEKDAAALPLDPARTDLPRFLAPV